MNTVLPELRISLSDNQWPFEYTDHDRNIVRAVVYDELGYFYFVQSDRDDDFGKGVFIETSGGGVEKDEDLISALLRELREELGIGAEIICKLGVVDDYYNLIHRHNINNYYLCKAISFGEKSLTRDEIESFHLSTVKLKLSEALYRYEQSCDKKLGRLLNAREVPILHHAQKIIDAMKA